MTMTAFALMRGDAANPFDDFATNDSLPVSSGRRRRERDIPPLSPRKETARVVAIVVCVLSGAFFLQLTVIGSFQARAAQRQAFDRFRERLAFGTAPTSGADEEGHLLALGTPIALLEIPALGLKQIIGEGTTAGVLLDGPGHERDTVFPGQFGTSVIMGRRAGFGGAFSDIGSLKAGDDLNFTTAQGTFVYEVVGVRREGDVIPAVPAGSARLILATAGGSAFVPNGVLRVDANLVGTPVVGVTPPFRSSNLPARERVMHNDTSTLWVLAFWLQVLLLFALAAIWAWHRWGHIQAWIVFFPTLLFVGLAVSGEAARLLPNLL
ncbi:MAG: sortase [Actinomycetia bacterium]|nr:sortase [Actinomycetes bacterium]